MDNINKGKLALTGLFAGITAAIGWFGWLALLFAICLMLDYLSGTIVAMYQGSWESKLARGGLWHKSGSIIAVICAAIADIVLGLVINNIPHLTLPFTYEVVICPMVMVWYIFTELGSMIENAEKLGAPIPQFLRKFIAICKKNTEKAGDVISDTDQGDE